MSVFGPPASVWVATDKKLAQRGDTNEPVSVFWSFATQSWPNCVSDLGSGRTRAVPSPCPYGPPIYAPFFPLFPPKPFSPISPRQACAPPPPPHRSLGPVPSQPAPTSQ